MKVAIDLDATITAYPKIFSFFTKAFSNPGCKIYVITYRVPGTEEAVGKELESLYIAYDVLKITSEKAKYILEKEIDVLFDDTDAYFLELSESVAVFKVRSHFKSSFETASREHYNFDFDSKKWLYTELSGRKIK